MVGIRVVGWVGRLVGAAKTDQVRRQHTVASGHQYRDHLAVQVRPGGLAVHQQHRRGLARALIDIGHAQAIEFQVTRGVRKIGQAGKAGFGGAQYPVFVDVRQARAGVGHWRLGL